MIEDELAAILPGRDEDDDFTLGTDSKMQPPATQARKKRSAQ